MRSLGLVLLGVAGCYAPTVPVGNPCDPSAPVCPSGQSCLASDTGYVCSLGGGGGDDADSDGPPSDGNALCFGTGTVHDLCLPSTPSTTLAISSATTIDTAMVGGANCTMILAQPGGPSLCVIAARSIAITNTGVLIAKGANPLVLLAEDSIDIAGKLDVSSHRMTNVIGAGARAMCGNGINGTMANAQPQGGGGGAGGSFAGAGADGGPGRTGIAGGNALGAMSPTVLTGGCAGGNGGAGAGTGGAGNGGPGGGAVYLVAHGSIVVGGTVAASGAAGLPGTGGVDSGGGGGGGGSGGFIALDAPVITVTGILHANGGGGGGGNGNQIDRPGQPGGEPTGATPSATGGAGGTNGGGPGGRGFAAGMMPAAGGNGSNDFCGGGGGGGGAGTVRVFGVAPSSVGGMVSPPPS